MWNFVKSVWVWIVSAIVAVAVLIGVYFVYRWFYPASSPQLRVYETLKQRARGSYEEKQSVVRYAKDKQTAGTYPILVLLLNDNEVGREARQAVKEIGEPMIDSLITALEHGPRDLKIKAGVSLMEIGNESVSRLVKLLDSKDVFVRRYTQFLLSQLGSTEELQKVYKEEAEHPIASVYAEEVLQWMNTNPPTLPQSVLNEFGCLIPPKPFIPMPKALPTTPGPVDNSAIPSIPPVPGAAQTLNLNLNTHMDVGSGTLTVKDGNLNVGSGSLGVGNGTLNVGSGSLGVGSGTITLSGTANITIEGKDYELKCVNGTQTLVPVSKP